MSRLLLKNAMRLAAVPRVATLRTPIMQMPTFAVRSFCDKKAPLEDAKDENGREDEEDSLSAVSDLEIQNQKLVQEVKDLKDKLLRTLAEEENVRRIAKRDVENAKAYANSSFAKSLLDVADNLERALAATKDSQKSAGTEETVKILLEGVEMTQTQLNKVFTTFGISKFGAVGEPFDPNLHDALFRIPTNDQPANTIGQVLKCGYKLKDRVIRAAEVGAIVKPE